MVIKYIRQIKQTKNIRTGEEWQLDMQQTSRSTGRSRRQPLEESSIEWTLLLAGSHLSCLSSSLHTSVQCDRLKSFTIKNDRRSNLRTSYHNLQPLHFYHKTSHIWRANEQSVLSSRHDSVSAYISVIRAFWVRNELVQQFLEKKNTN